MSFRDALKALSPGAPRALPLMSEVERLVARTGFSRFPVVDSDDDLLGYLHLKDVLYADDERYEQAIPAKRVRALVTVGAGDDVEDVLATMQRSGAHLARVVEADRVTGVVFLVPVLVGLYATHVAPFQLRVQHVDAAVAPARAGHDTIRIAVLADIHFGRRVPGDGQHIRFSYATSNAAIERGIARLDDFVRRHTV